MNVITIELEAELGGKKILQKVNIDVGKGEFVGIIGPNGSGKSTLLKCIYRVLQPTAGAVYLDKIMLSRLKLKESAKLLGVVAQQNYLNFDFSVEEFVMMGRAPHKKQMERDNAEDYRIMREALERVDMLSFESRSFSSLSGGEQQRIILARALVQQTDCLILDEPTNHLDIKYQLQILGIVKNSGVTVLAAIHDLNAAAMFCDRIYALNRGKIVCNGTPEEVLTTKLIRDLYEVEADVSKGRFGKLNIIYHPINGKETFHKITQSTLN
jgi:iron complex transport system ATP-binding protein